MDTTSTASAVTATTEPAPSNGSALTLTPAAVAQLKDVMQQQNLGDHLLAVRVVPAGCSGLGYDLNLVKEGKPGDISWQQDGITLTSDAISLKYLAGTQMDFVKGDTASGFKFNNPNAKSSCGCGSSFSA
jgi:iron-sulfur cluster assembly accessory protein